MKKNLEILKVLLLLLVNGLLDDTNNGYTRIRL